MLLLTNEHFGQEPKEARLLRNKPWSQLIASNFCKIVKGLLNVKGWFYSRKQTTMGYLWNVGKNLSVHFCTLGRPNGLHYGHRMRRFKSRYQKYGKRFFFKLVFVFSDNLYVCVTLISIFRLLRINVSTFGMDITFKKKNVKRR